MTATRLTPFGTLTRVLGPLIDQIEFDIPPEFSVQDGNDRKPKYISASRIKDCSRQLYLSLTQHETGISVMKPEWRIAAAQGTLIHDQIQAALLEYGVIHQPESYIPRVAGIAGRIDGVLTDSPTLLEIKTMGSSHWTTLPNNDKFDSYQDQIQIYLEILNLPQALLVCVRREPIINKTKIRKSLCKEYVIQRDYTRGRELLDKALRIHDNITNGIVPAAEPGEGCMFCPFQLQCELIDIEATMT